MKYIKSLLLFCVVLVTSVSQAAIIHDVTLTGSGVEQISVYLSYDDLDPLYDFTSYGWESDILLYDDQDGYIRFTWHSAYGDIFIEYTVTAEDVWTLTSGSPTGFSAASMATLSYLYFPQ